jgi:hypothetical protein
MTNRTERDRRSHRDQSNDGHEGMPKVGAA